MTSVLCFFKAFPDMKWFCLPRVLRAQGQLLGPCKLHEPFSRLTASSRQTAEYNVLNINLFPEAIETRGERGTYIIRLLGG